MVLFSGGQRGAHSSAITKPRAEDIWLDQQLVWCHVDGRAHRDAIRAPCPTVSWVACSQIRRVHNNLASPTMVFRRDAHYIALNRPKVIAAHDRPRAIVKLDGVCFRYPWCRNRQDPFWLSISPKDKIANPQITMALPSVGRQYFAVVVHGFHAARRHIYQEPRDLAVRHCFEVITDSIDWPKPFERSRGLNRVPHQPHVLGEARLSVELIEPAKDCLRVGRRFLELV